jgi:phosphate transport system substrate-binding protein
VGGSGPITAYQREENSGSQQLMKNLVMKDVPLYRPTEEYQLGPQLIGRIMSSTFLELTSDEKGIGYSVYYYEHFMSGSPRTCTIAVDGVEPNPETIGKRKYPYVSEVFVVTRKGLSKDAPAAKMRAWLLSPEGQSVVRASGYVPLLATVEK